jgi:ABC-type antimicrobial peptide transport system permease subunit
VHLQLLAGADFPTASPGTDPVATVLVSRSYAKAFGFGSNPEALVGQTITLVTQQGYSGIGASVTPPPQNGNGQNGNGAGCNGPCGSATRIAATVLGVVDEEDDVVHIQYDFARAMMVDRRYQGSAGTSTMQLVTNDQVAQAGFAAIITSAADERSVDPVALAIRAMGPGAATAKTQVQDQSKVFDILGYVLGGIGGIALAVAAIGVVNTMVMATLERTREIGIMRACGASRRDVRRLFGIEAATLGFLGGVVGVAVGFGLTKVANLVVNDQLASKAIRSRNIIHLPPYLAVAVIAVTTAIGVLAGFFPARRAARLDPLEALRYE